MRIILTDKDCKISTTICWGSKNEIISSQHSRPGCKSDKKISTCSFQVQVSYSLVNVFTLLEKTVPREGIYEEIRRCGLKVAVAGIPKTIDNDIPVIDKSFGFDTAFEEAPRAINAAHVESDSIENGIGLVKYMGRYSGYIAMYATLASRHVDCCLIPELPF